MTTAVLPRLPRLSRVTEARALSRRQVTTAVEHVALVGLLVFWAGPFTSATGGRGVHSELLFAAVVAAALLLSKVWRAPAASTWWALAVGISAIAVCVFAPTGWSGLDAATGYVLSALTFVVARRFVRGPSRRALIAPAICLAGLYQFSESFLPWWGSKSAATEMSGTFYWHNPYAAFLLPAAIIGVALVVESRAPWRLVGWVSVPLCSAGIVYSSSRAVLAALVVGLVLVVAGTARSRAALTRGVSVLLLTVGVVFALPGPPLFPHYTSPFAAIAARSAGGQTLSQNGMYRTQFWREAAEVAAHHPVAGAGYHSLATASALYTPSAWVRSPLAHNGFLQPLADGGLLLGVPFLGALVVIAGWALRRVGALVRPPPGRHRDVLAGAVGIALLAALAHSVVDFDWSYPSIMVEGALLAACAAPARPTARCAPSLSSGIAATVLGAALAVTCAFGLHRWQLDQDQPAQQVPAELLHRAQAAFGDYRPAVQVLTDVTAGAQPVSRTQALDALTLTRTAASIDLHLALLRDAVAAQFGVDPEAVEHAHATLRAVHGDLSPYVPDLARVMVAAGDTAEARSVLAADLHRQVVTGHPGPNLQRELETWAAQLGRGASYACAVKSVRGITPAASIPGLPRPAVQCAAAATS